MPRQDGFLDIALNRTLDLSSEPLQVPPDRLLRSRDVVHDRLGAPRMRPSRKEANNPVIPTVGNYSFGSQRLLGALIRGSSVAAITKDGLVYRGTRDWHHLGNATSAPAACMSLGYDIYPFSVSGPNQVLSVETVKYAGFVFTLYVTNDDQNPLEVWLRIEDANGDPVTASDMHLTSTSAIGNTSGFYQIGIVPSNVDGVSGDVKVRVFWKGSSGAIFTSLVTVPGDGSYPTSSSNVDIAGATYAYANGFFRVAPTGDDTTDDYYIAYDDTSSTIRLRYMVGTTTTATYDTTVSIASMVSIDLARIAGTSKVALVIPNGSDLDLITVDEITLANPVTTASAIAGQDNGMVCEVGSGDVFVAGFTAGSTDSLRGKIFDIDPSHSELFDTGEIHGYGVVGFPANLDGLPVFAAKWAGVTAELGLLMSVAFDDASGMFFVPCGRFGNDAVGSGTQYRKIRENERDGRRDVAFSYPSVGIGWETDIRPLIVRNDTPERVQSVEHESVTYIGGSHLTVFDGSVHRENDWGTVKPVIGTVSGAASTGTGIPSTGTWSFRAVWAWIDASGRMHRSAPSDAVTASLTTGDKLSIQVSWPKATTCVTNLHGASPEEGVREFFTEIYAQDPGGSDTFHHLLQTVTRDVTALQPDSFVTTSAYDYGVFEGVEVNNENAALYVEPEGSGELVVDPSPAVHDLELIGDRLWLVDAEQRTKLWPSKLFTAGYAFEFSAALVQSVPGADIVALSNLGGLPLVLREDGAYLIYGDGPNNAGSGDVWTPARKIATAPGCTSKQSVIKIPSGVIYQSRRGLFLLKPDQSATHISSGLDLYLKDITIIRATYSEADHRVVFWADSSSDESLCWDTETGLWSTWDTGRAQQAAVQVQSGGVYTIDLDGSNLDLSSYTTGTYDGETGLHPTWRTAWLQPSGLHGRVEWCRVILTARNVSDHRVKISVYADGDDSAAVATETLINPDTELRGNVYTWHVTKVFSSASSRRSRSLMVEIELDRDTDGGSGESAYPIGLRVEYKADGRTHRSQATAEGRS